MAVNFLENIRLDEISATTKAIEFGDDFVITNTTTITQLNNLVNVGVTVIGVTDSGGTLQYGVGTIGGGKTYLSYDGSIKLETTTTGIDVLGGVAGGSIVITEKDTSGSALSTDGEFGVGSQVFKYLTTSTTAGEVYSLGSSGWVQANASTVAAASTGLLAIASSTSSADGMTLKGVVKSPVAGTAGDIVYLHTTAGELTTTAPTTATNVVRIVGYLLGTNLVYFDPSKDYIEIAS